MLQPHPTPSVPNQRSVTPTWSVLAFTFINSLGTGVVTSGIFFLTKEGYDFGDVANFGLGVLLGVTYVAGALAAGPALRWLRRVAPGLSNRAVLGWISALLTLLCLLPLAAQRAGVGGPWPIWVLVGLYSPLTGVLWPMVESFLSGGRSGQRLVSTVGTWNVVWSSSLVVAYWGVAPLIKDAPAEAIAGLALSHVLGAVTLAWFAKDPQPHVHADHAPHPPVFERLLVAFRILLPASYVVSSALSPYLAGLMPRLGVPADWRTVAATAWLIPRSLTFLVLSRWQAWHGRWWPVVAGAATVTLGFVLVVVSGLTTGPLPEAGAPDAPLDVTGLSLMLAGLALFGVGMGTIYSGAIYYALEVGKAEVDAGGAHEALIGLGYTLGPAAGLAASFAVASAFIRPQQFDLLVLGLVGLCLLGAGGVLARNLRRSWRTGP